MLHSLLTLTSFSHMYADFKLKFNLQCLLFEHFRYDHSSVLIQPPRSHRLDPARPMSMHGPLHGCSARPNLEAAPDRQIHYQRHHSFTPDYIVPYIQIYMHRKWNNALLKRTGHWATSNELQNKVCLALMLYKQTKSLYSYCGPTVIEAVQFSTNN